MRNFLLTFFGLLFTTLVMGQTAVQGKITDPKGEGVIGANVKFIKNGVVKVGVQTDLDGNFSVSVDPGTYDLEVSVVGYKKVLIKGLKALSGQTTEQNIAMEEEGVSLDVVVIKEYKKPLFEKDKTTGGAIVTSEEIAKMPTRSVQAIAATTAGVSAIDGGDVTIKGSRSNATVYFLDGVRVFGNLPPVQEIEQLQIVTGGVEAQYGDVTGGVISAVSKGPSSRYSGGLEFETSKFLDPYGYLLLNGNVSGPIIKKENETLLGFRFSGQYLGQDDDNPRATGVWVAKEEAVKKIEANPVRRLGTNPLSSAEFLRTSDFNLVKTRPNEGAKRIDLTGKLDARLTKDIDVTLSGTYYNNQDQFTPGGWQELNTAYNPTRYETRYRGNFRFRHRLGGSNTDGQKNSIIRNPLYTLQASYEKVNTSEYDARYQDRFFEYGYVGEFEREYRPIAGIFNSSTTFCTVPGLADPVPCGQIGTLTRFIKYTPSASINQLRTNYNQLFDPTSFNDLLAINGRLSSTFNTVWDANTSVGFTNTGAVYNAYRKGETEIINFNANSSFDILPNGSEKGRHSVQFGLLYEQRVGRSYAMAPERLWELAQQSANRHIIGIDTLRPDGTFRTNELIINGFNVRLNDSVDVPKFKNLLSVDDPDLFFYKAIRNNTNLDQYINVDKFTPDQLSLKMFAPRELTDLNLVNFYGYDYLGNKTSATTQFKEFFDVNPNTGLRDFLVAPNQPIYTAAYIQDKFQYKDIIFRVGVRVDRFDANTKVMKDPFSLYEIVGAKDFHTQIGSDKPNSIGDDYKVYVERAGSGQVKAYRNGEQWYFPSGSAANDGNLIFGGEVVTPQYVQQNGKDPDITLRDYINQVDNSFTDYKPQINIMPRLAFSFPISDNANFFAHYDVLAQRPPSNNIATALNYFYFFFPGRYDDGDNPISNPNLRPEKTIDYEVGFQQKITNSSALKLTAYYKEFRDMIQRRTYLYVPTVNQYTTYDNRDFGTAKGFTVQYDLRRTNNIQMNIAYTWQVAEGTGSDANSQRGLTQNGNLRTLFPLSFDERHSIVTTIDYRYDSGKKYNGPKIAGKNIFENTGINFQIFAVSGRPYTRKLQPTRFGGDGTVGQVNGSRLPWRFSVDMRIDRSFALNKSETRPISMSVFFRVQNLFDTRNVIGVYPATGSATNDGYLVSRLGRNSVDALIASNRDSQSFIEAYNRALMNPGFYTLPRRIFLGAMVNF